WTGKSRKDHPDYAWYIAERGQENTGLVHSMGQHLAELAADESDQHSEAFHQRLAAATEWNRAQGNQDAIPDRSSRPTPAGRGVLVTNPALPDLAVRRRSGRPTLAAARAHARTETRMTARRQDTRLTTVGYGPVHRPPL